MYCPLIQSIEVLRLEKRLDDKLLYLRDCLPEYSTFPFDMEPEQLPEGAPVPVNTIKVCNSIFFCIYEFFDKLTKLIIIWPNTRITFLELVVHL